jgi:hypothetical protein
MNLLQPTMLWALLAVPVILLLYILRPRHQRLIVPSVRLWQHLPSDLEGRPRWRLPVSNLLLLAQLIVAAAVALALARPALPGPTRQHLILLLDTSPSMLATDVSPNRLALAVSNARQLVGALRPDDSATLIAMDPTPRLVATGQGPHALDSALGQLTAAPARGDVASALFLASQTAEQSKDTHNRIVILSDGAFSGVSLKDLGAIPADVSVQQVGGSDNNQAVTALSVQPMVGSLNRFVGFAQLTNYAHDPAPVTFQASADGIVIDQKTVTLPARGHVEVSLPLPNGTKHLSVSLKASDVFSADNQAEVLVPDSQTIPVTLVANDPGDWPRALQTLPAVKLSIVPPTSYKPDNALVTIFVNFVPANLPNGNLVLVAPPRGNAVIPVTGDQTNADLVHADATSSLFSSVDLAGLFLPTIETFGDAPWAQPVADSTHGPVILQGSQNGRNLVVIGFDPAATEWPQRVSFPIFVANLVNTLVTPAVPSGVSAGAVVDLPPAPDATQLAIKLPDGKLDVFNVNGAPVRFTDTGQLGDYQLTYAKSGQAIAHAEFVVNRLSVADSNIMPQLDPVQLSQSGGPAGLPSEHEVWPWIAGGALALLGAEWLIYFRRLAR